MAVNYSLKTKRNEFRARGIFYTPPALGNYMKSFLPPDLTEIYDPTCGHGALLELFGPEVKKYGQEINPEAIPAAQSLPNSVIVHGDTLADPAFLDHRFRAIIANPPFSVRWTQRPDDPRFTQAPVLPPPSKADFAFLLHILYCLADTGTAVTIISGGCLYREAAEGKIRRWLVDQNYIDQIISIPPDTFEDTSVPVTVLVLKKSRPVTDITFSDKATGASLIIPREKIIENNYLLSPSQYLPQPEEDTAPPDPVALELESRAATIKRLKATLMLSRVIKEIDPKVPPLTPFLDELQSVINEARPRNAKLDVAVTESRENTVRNLKLAMEIEHEVQRLDPAARPIEPFLNELQAIIDQNRPVRPNIRLKKYPADISHTSRNLSLF